MQYIDDDMLILSQLINNKNYFKRVIHHLDKNLFELDIEQRIFTFIKKYSDKYGDAPNEILLKHALSKVAIEGDTEQYVDEYIKLVHDAEIAELEPLIDKTEMFVKDRSLKLALFKAVDIYKGQLNIPTEAIPEMIKEAVSTTIHDDSGSMYFSPEAAKRRLEAYNNPEHKIPFKVTKFNEVTNNGVTVESLNCIVAAPNVGKTAMLISLACDYVECGNDVLYVSCEMSEEQVGIRFDAHFLNKDTASIPSMNEDMYLDKFTELQPKMGNLIIKKYSTNELTAQKLELLIDELNTKNDFHPKVIMVDYLGICSSYMIKDRGNIGTYYTKVAEEFRAVSQRKSCTIWTAQQMTTESLDSTDPTLKNIGYGQGIAKTSDMVWFAIRTEELDKHGHLLIKQDKTRYHKERVVRFVVGFDIGRMKIYDADNDSIPMSIGASGEKNWGSTTPSQPTPPSEQKTKIASAFNNIGKKRAEIKA